MKQVGNSVVLREIKGSLGKEVTSMSRRRFMELRAGILNGELAERWKKLADKRVIDLTRKERVELYQLGAIVSLYESNEQALAHLVKDDSWRLMRVYMNGILVFGRKNE